MKKSVLLFFLMLTLNGHGQTSVYHPFPESNATWNVEWNNGWSVCIEDFSYTFSGDTVIANVTYHKINTPSIQNLGICNTIQQEGYKGCIRQDTSSRKIYYVAPDSAAEELLYDFNLQVGDSVQGFLRFNCFTITLAVIDIDSILIGTNYRKRWTTGTAIPYNPYNHIIEGIGFETGLLQQCPESQTDIPFFSLLCFEQDGITLYPDTLTNCHLIDGIKNLLSASQTEVFPNPFSHFLNVKSKSNQPLKIFLYDISMRKLQQQIFVNDAILNTETLSKGIYIYEIRNDSYESLRGKLVKN